MIRNPLTREQGESLDFIELEQLAMQNFYGIVPTACLDPAFGAVGKPRSGVKLELRAKPELPGPKIECASREVAPRDF